MRPRDIRDYMALRRLTKNPVEVLRYRKRQASGRDLLVRLRDGATLHVRSQRADYHMFHRIFLADEYRLANLAHRGLGVVVDLGGNVGLFAARAAALAERVISYEPIPESYALLEWNVAHYKCVDTVRAAASGEAGSLRIYHPRTPHLSGVYSSFREMGGHMSDRYDDVAAITLAEIFKRHELDRCDLLKIDVEGQEYDILYAAPEDVISRITRIHCEYHDVAREDPRSRIAALDAYLQRHGFDVELLPHRRKPNHGMLFATRNPAV
jgi:FkbM family methyltransferase